MKDNRSLEQKIREVHQAVLEAAFDRNTKIRMKVANVGRPTGENKLAKQGEIKTKIIDEDSEYGMARNELDTAKRAIDRLKTKMGKGEGELEAWVQAKITKASDYLDTVADYIESGSVKEETIEEDSVAGVSTKDTPKEQPESGNKKKENKKDLLEPGKITGGKTEVDTEPTTDDRDDDGKKIDDKAKKATKEANAKGGVKEEYMNSKNFGLPQSVIDDIAAFGKSLQEKEGDAADKKADAAGEKRTGMTHKEWEKSAEDKKADKKEKMKEYRADRDKHGEMDEELKGNQGKLDKNHNGKIDKQDFKILRKEEVVDEERMSKGRRDALARKTSFTADPPRRLEKPEPKETKSDKMKAYRADRDKHGEMEEEAIDEVLDTPMKKLGYIVKNAYQVATADPAKMANDPKKANAIANRVIGAKRFQKKLNKEETDPEFSEAELAHIDSIINEDSKDPYTSKSGKHIDSHMTDHDEPEGKPDHKIHLRNGDSVHVHYIKGENGKTKNTVMSHSGDYTSGSYSVPGKAHPKHIETSWNKALKPEHDYDD